MELIIFFLSCFLLFNFMKKWYKPIFSLWPAGRNTAAKKILGILPPMFLVLIFFVLKFFASFDVVNSVIYIIFYIVLGYAWMYAGMSLMALCFDMHWLDDAVFLNNKASVPATAGIFFALAFIYAGSNVGDGPGWWCVLLAGSLGLAAWIILGLAVNLCTGIFEQITVERDLGCGIRFLIYSLISGAILGYACSGDWTSFYMTVIEFAAGWPVLPLTAVFIIIESLFKQKAGVSG